MQLDQKASTNLIELHLISAFFVISKAIFHCIPFFESCDAYIRDIFPNISFSALVYMRKEIQNQP